MRVARRVRRAAWGNGPGAIPAPRPRPTQPQDSFTRDHHTGVARFEGVGLVTVAQARDFLGAHCTVTIKPVIDVAHQAPADGYEVPTSCPKPYTYATPPWL